MIRTFSALIAALALVAFAPSPTPAPASSAARALPPGLPNAVHGARRVPGPSPSASPSGDVMLPSSAPGAPAPGGAADTFSFGVWTVHASSLDANFKTGEFSTPDKVVMTRVGGDVSADRSDGNYKQQLVNLYGHVVMHDSTGEYGEHSGSGHSGGPSTLTADKAEIDGKAKMYKAIGNVHYISADTSVTAANGTLNELTHDLFLQGDVHVAQGPRSVTAETMHYNTVTGQAHAETNVTMQLPGQFSRGIATPKPIHLPKTPVSQPVTPPSP
jgi:lipopolysaccharide export system protein LptC